MTLGERIKEARLRRKLTQQELAGDLITRNMLSQIENNIAMPSMRTLAHLAKSLEVSMSVLLSEEERGGSFAAQEIPWSIAHKAVLDELGFINAETPPEKQARAYALLGEIYLRMGQYEKAEACFYTAKEWFEISGQTQELIPIYVYLEECSLKREDFRTAYMYAALRRDV